MALQLTGAQAELIRKKRFANALAKVRAGKSITRAEQELIDSFAETKTDGPKTATRFEPVRWLIGRAAAEFGIDAKTLAKRLKAAGTEPGKDGKFATLEICRAIYGDLEMERTRLTAEQADIAAINKAEMLRQLLPAALVERIWSATSLALAQAINYAAIPEGIKRDLARQCAAIPIADYFTQPADADGDEENKTTQKKG